jgi:hypothetical protein
VASGLPYVIEVVALGDGHYHGQDCHLHLSSPAELTMIIRMNATVCVCVCVCVSCRERLFHEREADSRTPVSDGYDVAVASSDVNVAGTIRA